MDIGKFKKIQQNLINKKYTNPMRNSIDCIYNENNNFLNQFNDKKRYYFVKDTLSIKSIMLAIKDKFKNSFYQEMDVSYVNGGGEAKIFLINDLVIVKVFCGKISLEKNYNDLKNELKEQEINLNGINGLARPLNTDEIKIEGKKYLIQTYKFMEYGSLYNMIIYDEYPRNCSRFELVLKLALCVSYLHQMGIAHNDLKPENIFLNCKNNVKIGDFGFSSRLNYKNRKLLGSMGYIAPELLIGNNSISLFEQPLKADIFSLGVIFFLVFLPEYYTSWENIKNSNFRKNRQFYKNNCEVNIKCYFDYCNRLIEVLKYIKKDDQLINNLRLYTDENSTKKKLIDLMLGMLEIDPVKRFDIKQVKEKLAEIYKLVEKKYMNGYIPIILKNRQLFDLGIGENLYFTETEVKKMEKNLVKRMNSIVNDKKISNTLRYNIKNTIDEIFPNNPIKFNCNSDKKLVSDYRMFLDDVKNQLEKFRNIKILYCKNSEDFKNDTEFIDLEFVNTLGKTIEIFDEEESCLDSFLDTEIPIKI